MENNKADIIYKGRVITLDNKDTIAQAIGVKQGKIIFIGSVKEADKFIGSKTKLVDLGHNCIYPGFIEGHAHGLLASNKFAWFADLTKGKTVQDYLDILRHFIEDHPGREDYVGNGCILNEKPLPTYQMLDEISKDVCIYMQTEDGHTLWVNSKVLEKFKDQIEEARKIDPETVDVDENGKPTGILSDAICMTIFAQLKEPNKVVKRGLMDWQTLCFSEGYTAAVDAAIAHNDSIKAPECYSELAKEGKLKLRTYASYFITETGDKQLQEIKYAKECAKKFNCEYFKINSTKFFMDGVVEAHTAGLTKDYCNTPGNKGQLRISDSHLLAQWMEESFKNGLGVHIHSVGDAATQIAVAAAAEVRETICDFGQRIILAHLQLVRPEDFAKFGEYQIIACVPPLWVPKSKVYYPQEVTFLGEERASHAYPIKSFVDQNTTIIFHTDFPVSQIVSIPHAIFRAIERYRPQDGVETQRWKEEGISRKEALYALTKNVAYSINEQDRLGTLEIGKIANMSVFDTDFLNCKVEEIPDAELVNTIVDGQIVY